MGLEISRRQWDQVVERITKLEGQLRKYEVRFELIEKRLKPGELHRIVKQQEQEEAVAADASALKPKIT